MQKKLHTVKGCSIYSKSRIIHLLRSAVLIIKSSLKKDPTMLEYYGARHVHVPVPVPMLAAQLGCRSFPQLNTLKNFIKQLKRVRNLQLVVPYKAVGKKKKRTKQQLKLSTNLALCWFVNKNN